MTISQRFLATCAFTLSALIVGQTAPAALFTSVDGTMDGADNYTISVTDSGDDNTVFNNNALDINVAKFGFVQDGQDEGIIVGFDVKDGGGLDIGAASDQTTIILAFADGGGVTTANVVASFTGATTPDTQALNGSFTLIVGNTGIAADGSNDFEIGIPLDKLGGLFDEGTDASFELTITAKENTTTHVDQVLVPEPASTALIALGGVALLGRRARRQRH